MQRAIAYIRVSTDRQAKDGTSLVTQRKRVLEYATVKAYELVRQFVEEGESAKTDDRPVLQEMLQFCKKQKGRIDVLIFPKIDRFARYAADYHFLKGYLRDLGIRVESIDERFDDSPAGRFLESLLAATAQFDNDVRSERAFNGMKEAVSQGRWAWGAPRGYRNVRIGNKSTIEPDPQTSHLVAKVFEMLASGEARPKDARAWLATQGVRISRSQFYRMIWNKAYIGVIEAFGITQHSAPPFIALVSEAIFLKAQGAFRSSRAPRTYQRDHPEFPLRGTLRCTCGRFLTASWTKGRTRRYAYYRCKDCPRVNLERSLVESQFLELLSTTQRQYGLTPQVKESLSRVWENDCSFRIKRRSKVEAEVRSLTELQRAVAIKNAQGVLPDTLAKEQIEELEQKILEKRTLLSGLASDETNIKAVLDHGERFLANIPNFWQDSDLVVKKHVQRFFFPSGATVETEGDNRTANRRLVTGSQSSTQPHLSRVARPAHGSPNKMPREFLFQSTPNGPLEVIQSLIQIHREFGRPEDAG